MKKFDSVDFISNIVSRHLKENKTLTQEQRQALFKLYYRANRLNITHIFQIFQINAEQEFLQNLMIYLWKNHQSLIVNAAKNNKYIFKIQEIIVIISKGGEPDSIRQIEQIAKELNFTEQAMAKALARVQGKEFPEEDMNNSLAKKPFYKYFEDEVELPIPDTFETRREIPVAARMAALEKKFAERQEILKEQAKKSSLRDYVKNIINNLVNKLPIKESSQSLQADDILAAESQIKSQTKHKPVNTKFKRLMTKIVNALNFIKLSRTRKKTKDTEESFADIDSPSKDKFFGISSPSIDRDNSFAGISSPSFEAISPIGFSSPSPIINRDSSFAGFSSPSLDAGELPTGIQSPSFDDSAQTTDSTNYIIRIINKEDDVQQTLVVLNQEQLNQLGKEKLVKDLFGARNKTKTSPKFYNDKRPKKQTKNRVKELDENQENIDPNRREGAFSTPKKQQGSMSPQTQNYPITFRSP